MTSRAFFLIPVLLATSFATHAGEAVISIKEFMFSPTAMTVPAGTTVRWKNLDGEPHTVRSIDATFKSDALDQNDSFRFTFAKAGTYRYICSIHPKMKATITVH